MKHAMSTVNEEDVHNNNDNKPSSSIKSTPSDVKIMEKEKSIEQVGSPLSASTEHLNADTASTTSSIDKKLPTVPSPAVGDPGTPSSSSDHQSLRSASADVLLPLLIFSIVKSNPTNFLSNLRFIQRFRRPSRIAGQESYCLTNIVCFYFIVFFLAKMAISMEDISVYVI